MEFIEGDVVNLVVIEEDFKRVKQVIKKNILRYNFD